MMTVRKRQTNMPLINRSFEDLAGEQAVAGATLESNAWLWASLDDDQLEAWLGDYIWFSEFVEGQHRANCARTRDELVVECALRERHDLIRKAWARLARCSRGKR
jgi:hypothetical protein